MDTGRGAGRYGSSLISEDLLLRPLPDMVVVEKKDSPLHQPCTAAETATNQLWSLRADPGWSIALSYHALSY